MLWATDIRWVLIAVQSKREFLCRPDFGEGGGGMWWHPSECALAKEKQNYKNRHGSCMYVRDCNHTIINYNKSCNMSESSPSSGINSWHKNKSKRTEMHRELWLHKAVTYFRSNFLKDSLQNINYIIINYNKSCNMLC